MQFMKMSDIADLTVGYVGTMGKEYSDEGVKFLRSLNIKSFSFDLNDIKYVPKEFSDSISKSILHEDDVVIVRTGVPGTCAVIPKELEGCNCADLVIVHPNKKKVDPFYLCAFINSWGHTQVTNSRVGAIQKHFNIGDAIKMLIPDMPLSEQKKIGKFSSIINQRIEMNKSICSDLEAIAKQIYEYWFVQFDFPNSSGRPYKTSGGEMVWNDELKRDIPVGWKVKHISDYLNVVTGKEDANFASDNGEYAFFTCSNESYRCDIPKFSGKAILLAGNGDFNVKYYDGKFNAYQRTYVLMPEDESVIGLLYQCISARINALKNSSAGSIVKFITKGDVDNIPVLEPNGNVDFQSLNKYLELIQEISAENEFLERIRDYILPLLLSGQIRIED